MTTTKAQLKLDKKELSAEEISWIKDDSPSTWFAYPIEVIITCNIDMENKDENKDKPVSENMDYPANILVLQLAGTQFDPNQGDMFIRVADVTDLYELPTSATINAMNSRALTESTPYYRTNRFKLLCRSAEEAQNVWTILKQEAKAFINSYNTAHNSQLSSSETVYV